MNKVSKALVLTLGLLVGFTVKANTVSAATLNYDKSGYWYQRQEADGSNKHSWYQENYYVDGQVAYCIEPGIPEGNPMYEADWSATGLSDSIKERILLIGYYGYTYPGHQTINYRAATQGMIWKEILGNNTQVIFSTQRWGAGDRLSTANEEAEINRLIASHYIKPSFDAGVYKVQVGETLTLTDTNNVLSNYSISVSGAEYSVNGNALTIKPTQSGNIDLTMTKNMPYASGYKLFVGDKIQNMFVPGTTDPVISRIRLNTYTSTVKGNKLDSETGSKAQCQATLKC